jgi:hypothetical protein
MTEAPSAPALLRAARHVAGLATVDTVAALLELGVFERLAGPRAVTAAAAFGRDAATGFQHVALRLLRCLDWVEALGPDPASARFSLSALGRRMRPLLPAYLAAHRTGNAVLPPHAADTATLALAQAHLDGYVHGPALLRLHDAQASGAPLAALTPDRRHLIALAAQYRHPVCYAPLLRRVRFLLGPDAAVRPHGDEHLDRGADIRFSGDVYRARCAGPARALLARVADRHGPVQALLDIGAGDGTMLLDLHAMLAPGCPGLIACAVEPSAAARTVLAARLRAAGIPHRVLDGDVAQPHRLATALAAQGIAAADCLVTMKSVLHDRALRLRGSARIGRSRNCFAAPDGAALDAGLVEADLIACLAAWRHAFPTREMLVIEAHTAADPQTLGERALGEFARGLLAGLDATHGYSAQYLVEADVHRQCCEDAGFAIPEDVRLGEAELGFAFLSLMRLSPGA